MFIECHYKVTDKLFDILNSTKNIKVLSILYGYGNFTDLIHFTIL